MNCASSIADHTPPLSARTLMSVESLIVIGVGVVVFVAFNRRSKLISLLFPAT